MIRYHKLFETAATTAFVKAGAKLEVQPVRHDPVTAKAIDRLHIEYKAVTKLQGRT